MAAEPTAERPSRCFEMFCLTGGVAAANFPARGHKSKAGRMRSPDCGSSWWAYFCCTGLRCRGLRVARPPKTEAGVLASNFSLLTFTRSARPASSLQLVEALYLFNECIRMNKKVTGQKASIRNLTHTCCQ